MGINREAELAWAAGFFDGEGNTYTYIGNTEGYFRRKITCTIGQIDREVLDKFTDIVGVGGVRGPYLGKTSTSSPYYMYRCSAVRDVRRIWSILEIYLSTIKCEQFKISLEKYDNFILARKRRPLCGVEFTGQ
jgi:hypothetical protein